MTLPIPTAEVTELSEAAETHQPEATKEAPEAAPEQPKAPPPPGLMLTAALDDAGLHLIFAVRPAPSATGELQLPIASQITYQDLDLAVNELEAALRSVHQARVQVAYAQGRNAGLQIQASQSEAQRQDKEQA